MSAELQNIPENVKASISNFEKLQTIDDVINALREPVLTVLEDYKNIPQEDESHQEWLAYVNKLAQVKGPERAFQAWLAAQEKENK